MDEQEKKVLDLLGLATTEFVRLGPLHQSDLPEFVHAIHAAQNIVLARGSLRAMQNASKKVPK